MSLPLRIANQVRVTGSDGDLSSVVLHPGGQDMRRIELSYMQN